MRNNEKRMAPPVDSSISQTSISDLNYVIPTEIVDLPSKGKFYPAGHPLCEKDVVEIKHMTAKEEDILTSTTLIQKGVVLDYLLKSLLIDPSIDPSTLLSGDKNAIFLNARINGYGSTYDVESHCVECGEKQEIDYNLQDIKEKETSKDVIYDRGCLKFKLPRCGHNVRVKFLNTREEASLEDELEKREKMNLPPNPITMFLKTVIVSINDTPNKGGSLFDFIDSLPSMDVQHIKKVYTENKPDLDFSVDVECSHCGSLKRRELPITADFFWPDA